MAFADGTADFRSDTVTRPTSEMRRAMAEAAVGDDVYGDDPTVNALEHEAAATVGKDAAVFVPTGTMGNQLAIMVSTSPGEEVIVDEFAHIRNTERGWGPAHAGIGWRTVSTAGGRITSDHVSAAMELAGVATPRVSLVAFENTHNFYGGRTIPAEVVEQTAATARGLGLAVHIDGARIFNACVALGVSVERFAAAADTIQFCFSKGLGAPVGSIVCGDSELMDEVRYLRKRLGGGMRQAGILAAAARIALRDWERLVDDHAVARHLAHRLAERWPGSVDPDAVETNLVNVEASALPLDLEAIRHRLDGVGIVTNPARAGIWRLVTHRDVNIADVDRLTTEIGAP